MTEQARNNSYKVHFYILELFQAILHPNLLTEIMVKMGTFCTNEAWYKLWEIDKSNDSYDGNKTNCL